MWFVTDPVMNSRPAPMVFQVPLCVLALEKLPPTLYRSPSDAWIAPFWPTARLLKVCVDGSLVYSPLLVNVPSKVAVVLLTTKVPLFVTLPPTARLPPVWLNVVPLPTDMVP